MKIFIVYILIILKSVVLVILNKYIIFKINVQSLFLHIFTLHKYITLFLNYLLTLSELSFCLVLSSSYFICILRKINILQVGCMMNEAIT